MHCSLVKFASSQVESSRIKWTEGTSIFKGLPANEKALVHCALNFFRPKDTSQRLLKNVSWPKPMDL